MPCIGMTLITIISTIGLLQLVRAILAVRTTTARRLRRRRKSPLQKLGSNSQMVSLPREADYWCKTLGSSSKAWRWWLRKLNIKPIIWVVLYQAVAFGLHPCSYPVEAIQLSSFNKSSRKCKREHSLDERELLLGWLSKQGGD